MSRRRRMKVGRVAVSGNSMIPTYHPGDWLVVLWGGRPRVGRVVVAERGDGTQLIKRVVRRHESGWWLEGESPESVDSRSLGPFDDDQIRALVLFRYRRAGS